MKKAITMFLSMAMLVTCITMTGAHASAAEADYGTTITEFKAGSNNLYVYYPTPNAQDTSTVKLTCTAPSYLVFGDGTMKKEDCIKYATESGLAKLAAENGSSVIFVQPISGTWSAQDVDAYTNVFSLLDDSSTSVLKNGMSESVNFMTGEAATKISGNQQRVCVYGIGSGADYIVAHWLRKCEAKTSWGGTTDATMASATLEKVSDVTSLISNDIPTVSISNSEAVNQALKTANTNGLFLTDTGRNYAAQAAKLAGNYRRQDGILIKIPDYAAEGITEKIEAVTVSTSPDNTFTKEKTNVINYVTYYSDELNVAATKKTVPLVVTFHGGGNTAKYQAMALEWPEIAKANNFILVSVDLHYPNHTPTEIVALINALKKEYPCINPSRIYATGFSMGSDKTWKLFEQYPEVFAGVAPMHGSFAPAENGNAKTLVPTFFVAGEISPLVELPNNVKDEKTGVIGNDINTRLSYLFKVNNIKTPYTFQQGINKWGIAPKLSYAITDTKTFKNSVLTVNLYQSKDGHYYTALANSSNQSHELFARNAWAAWDFLSQFSRKADGTISISKVTYDIASDDGSVTSNSYNTKKAVVKTKSKHSNN
jgi:poly(3-hydroxybutyrate) depolymerase